MSKAELAKRIEPLIKDEKELRKLARIGETDTFTYSFITLSVPTISSAPYSFNILYASPKSKACDTPTNTLFAPCSLSILTALAAVLPVLIISSIIIASLPSISTFFV